MKEAGYVLYGIYVLLTGWLLVNALVQLHLCKLAGRNDQKKKNNLPDPLPFITIQVPVYNEMYVIEGLLDSLASIDYPTQLFEILVLDDSADHTSSIIDQKVTALQSRGLQIDVLRRSQRKEYKAGALHQSLSRCKGEFIAIFDADFRPSPSFLKELLPHFQDEKVGLVQARWAHLNRNQNFLTRIQAFLLDTYFSVEQAGRDRGGFFSNFCGTAGLWRKSCLEDAGGWDGTVLSEDLDISYRAQLKGWKIVYDGDVEVPAELPPAAEAFKIQQFRWTKGIMQVLRKNGPAVFRSSMPLNKKVHAFIHLSGSFVFPCLFINSLLALPLLLLRKAYPEFIALTNLTAIGGINLLLLTWVFYVGTQSRESNVQFARYFPVFLLVYMAMSVQNTVAVLQGLFGRSSAFIRTPKFAERKAAFTSYLPQKINGTHLLELATLLYFLCGISLSFYLDDFFFLVLFLMMSVGLGILIYQTHAWRKEAYRVSPPKISWR